MTPTSQSDWFTQTSHEPYDRHNYQLYIKEQEEPITFDDYDLLRAAWFKACHLGRLSHVKVVDIKQKDSKGKGFM